MAPLFVTVTHPTATLQSLITIQRGGKPALISIMDVRGNRLLSLRFVIEDPGWINELFSRKLVRDGGWGKLQDKTIISNRLVCIMSDALDRIQMFPAVLMY